jgi:hypothetical protein
MVTESVVPTLYPTWLLAGTGPFAHILPANSVHDWSTVDHTASVQLACTAHSSTQPAKLDVASRLPFRAVEALGVVLVKKTSPPVAVKYASPDGAGGREEDMAEELDAGELAVDEALDDEQLPKAARQP